MAKNSEIGAAPQDQPAAAAASDGARSVKPRKAQYLVASRSLPALQTLGLQPFSFNVVEEALRAAPDIDVVDTLGPKTAIGAFADGLGTSPTVLVTRMSDQKAFALHQQAQGRLIVEPDQHLSLHEPAFQGPYLVTGVTPSGGAVLSTTIIVVDPNNQPVAGADVSLYGSLLPASGTTDARGQVVLSLFGETPDSLRGLYVKPKSDYWSFYQQNPDISTSNANVVLVQPLSAWPQLSNFPQRQVLGWGQKAMRLDQLPDQYRGQGIKVAVIDSGAAALTHADLKQIRYGFDILNKKDHPDTWTDDVISHGSHCAGVIAGANNGQGVRGFAPDAEIHVCKLFPGGQISQLIDALEYCIEKQIDVVNLSLGGAEPSEALEQQILRAKRAGIACIVAAGNSGGAVQYPASSPNVLAVAAIGKLGEFPSDSGHSQTISKFVDADGHFAAKFSCFGPEVAVCAPGVAITSSVPGNNYAVWDGTSMAAPHITGLAALVLAHHPDFQGAYKSRGPERVERLFQIIKSASRRLYLGDAGRTGFGLPDTLFALGLQTPAGTGQTLAAPAAGARVQAPVAQPQVTAEQVFASQAWNPLLAPLGGQLGGLVGGQFGGRGQLGQIGRPSGLGGLDPSYALYLNTLLAQSQFGGNPGLFN
ncbi:S8 family serine peptidase [Massilia sp. MB5]|uniref:S8 family serine peptidase n=1 Tax=unclassified Massilia TaxID=2609279 RepID=UPI00067C7370|nr:MULTISPECIES: S8 family serine peptidase [unclassified Massilia]UMR29650.1 S8 family serine peptidase [Massilia sp. MB5]